MLLIRVLLFFMSNVKKVPGECSLVRGSDILNESSLTYCTIYRWAVDNHLGNPLALTTVSLNTNALTKAATARIEMPHLAGKTRYA